MITGAGDIDHPKWCLCSLTLPVWLSAAKRPQSLRFPRSSSGLCVEYCCDSTDRLFRLASVDNVVGFKKALLSASNLSATSDEPECHQTEFLTPRIGWGVSRPCRWYWKRKRSKRNRFDLILQSTRAYSGFVDDAFHSNLCMGRHRSRDGAWPLCSIRCQAWSAGSRNVSGCGLSHARRPRSPRAM